MLNHLFDRPWWPLTYDAIHVQCAKEIKTPVPFESVIVTHTSRKCGGHLWYRWNDLEKIAFDITCDKCNKSFHPNQYEMF